MAKVEVACVPCGGKGNKQRAETDPLHKYGPELCGSCGGGGKVTANVSVQEPVTTPENTPVFGCDGG